MADIITLNQDYGEYGRAVFEIDRDTGEGNVSYFPNLPLERIFVTINLKRSDNMTKSNVHLIADESLGGIQREYIEVEREANVGDYVTTEYHTHTVSEVNSRVILAGDLAGYYSRIFKHGEYTTLEPTDIVHVWETAGDLAGLVRRRLVERKAEVGEKVIVTTEGNGWYDDKIGQVFTVIDGNDYGFDDNYMYVDHEPSRGSLSFISPGNYRVLIPVAPSLECTPENRHEEVFVEETQCSPQVLDMLANLARRVTSLESQLKDTQGDVERQAQELATLEQVVKSVKERGITTAEQTESNTQDIADLDDRTQSLVEPKQAAEALLRKIAKLIEEEGVGI